MAKHGGFRSAWPLDGAEPLCSSSAITLTNSAPSATYILSAFCAEFQKDNPSPSSRFSVEPPDEHYGVHPVQRCEARPVGSSKPRLPSGSTRITSTMERCPTSCRFLNRTGPSLPRRRRCRSAGAQSQPFAGTEPPSGSNGQPKFLQSHRIRRHPKTRQWKH